MGSYSEPLIWHTSIHCLKIFVTFVASFEGHICSQETFACPKAMISHKNSYTLLTI